MILEKVLSKQGHCSTPFLSLAHKGFPFCLPSSPHRLCIPLSPHTLVCLCCALGWENIRADSHISAQKSAQSSLAPRLYPEEPHHCPTPRCNYISTGGFPWGFLCSPKRRRKHESLFIREVSIDVNFLFLFPSASCFLADALLGLPLPRWYDLNGFETCFPDLRTSENLQGLGRRLVFSRCSINVCRSDAGFRLGELAPGVGVRRGGMGAGRAEVPRACAGSPESS